MSDHGRVAHVVRWCLVGVVLSAVGVMAMPLPELSGNATSNGGGEGQGRASADLADMAAIVPNADDVHDAVRSPQTPSPIEKGAGQGDGRMAVLHRLVDDICGVSPNRIRSGPDALTIDLPLAADDDPCLDEVALMFDREQPEAPELLFDVTAVEAEQDFPVLHISAIYTGPMPYLHLKNGKTLFIGAIVNGWKLAAIDDQGAAFTYGDRRFVLRASDDRDES